VRERVGQPSEVLTTSVSLRFPLFYIKHAISALCPASGKSHTVRETGAV
jgi:hypothetical protein